MMCLLLRTAQSTSFSLEIMSGNKLVVQNDGSNVTLLEFLVEHNNFDGI